MFAKLKPLLREVQPRDVEASWRKVVELLGVAGTLSWFNNIV
jgi:hypothetical protein